MKTELGGLSQTLQAHLNAVAEMSRGRAKESLSKAYRNDPTYTHDILYSRVPRKLLLKWWSFWEESPYPVEGCYDAAGQLTASTPKHPPEPSIQGRYVPAKCWNTILLYGMQTQRKRLPSGDVKWFPVLVANITVFVISKVWAILAPVDVESLNALSIGDLKNICSFRLCGFSCRKSNYMMETGNLYLSFDFTSVTKKMLNLTYTGFLASQYKQVHDRCWK
jgi:hypothetical protein